MYETVTQKTVKEEQEFDDLVCAQIVPNIRYKWPYRANDIEKESDINYLFFFCVTFCHFILNGQAVAKNMNRDFVSAWGRCAKKVLKKIYKNYK